jgi:putative Holliday junction resolvase
MDIQDGDGAGESFCIASFMLLPQHNESKVERCVVRGALIRGLQQRLEGGGQGATLRAQLSPFGTFSFKISHLSFNISHSGPHSSSAAYNRAVPGEQDSDVAFEPSEGDLRPERSRARILGLDVGARRIGIAVSDPLGITAQGLETLQRRNKRSDLAALERVIREFGVKEIVVGLPLRMSGLEGRQAEKMQIFAEDLRKRFRLPVHMWDERLTSAEANRLLRETELSIEKRGKAVDRMAAVLILQGWMERRVRSDV